VVRRFAAGAPRVASAPHRILDVGADAFYSAPLEHLRRLYGAR
jgi:hypothetical protein